MCYAASKIAEAEQRGDTAAIAYWTGIRDLVDRAPTLTAEQKSVLRVLLHPAPTAEPAKPLRVAA